MEISKASDWVWPCFTCKKVIAKKKIIVEEQPSITVPVFGTIMQRQHRCPHCKGVILGHKKGDPRIEEKMKEATPAKK